VLAYLSQDKALLEAFKDGHDIHAETAARLFNTSLEHVTSAQRQIGKRINFSILYGLTPYGLSKDLGIPFKEAKQYIDTYFAQYPGVRAWMDTVVEEVEQKGYVTTHWGRRRYIPAIYEKNRVLYEEAKRVAINTVAQGTAAEIMKQGMIALAARLKAAYPEVQMLLQIHDELLISAPEGQSEQVEALMKETLEGVVDWDVPLVVTTRWASDWAKVSK
jgi:DNA polymerase I